jgi:hypothetical protein
MSRFVLVLLLASWCVEFASSACSAASASPCQDCVSSWGSWSACSATCNFAERERRLRIVTPAAGDGTPCPGLRSDFDECSVPPCPLPCLVTTWSDWSGCSGSCGELIFKQRVRQVYRTSMFGGAACPELSESSTCDVPACPTPLPTPRPPAPTLFPTPIPTTVATTATTTTAAAPEPAPSDAEPPAPGAPGDALPVDGDRGMWIGVGVGSGLAAVALAFLAAACIIRRRNSESAKATPPIHVRNRAAQLPPPLEPTAALDILPRYSQPGVVIDEREVRSYVVAPAAPAPPLYGEVPATGMISAARDRSITGTPFLDAQQHRYGHLEVQAEQYCQLAEMPIEYVAAPSFDGEANVRYSELQQTPIEYVAAPRFDDEASVRYSDMPQI